jgi:diacylglycerol kinase (ATP)
VDSQIIPKQLLENTIRKERKAVLVVNTLSRNGQRSFRSATDELAKQGITVTLSYSIQYPERLPEVIQETVKQGHKLIIVGGGDGTISSVIDYFACQDVVLGLLPLGTANSFARTLGIPTDLKGAVDVIANGKLVDVDLGKVGSDYFSNVITVGFAATIARNIPHRLKRYLGVMAYGLMGIKVFFSHKPFECSLIIKEGTFKFNTHQVVIANGGHFGITPLAPDASADDRELIVYVMDSPSRWDMMKLWIAFFLQKPAAFSQARFFKTREITLKTIPPQFVEVDGEITTQTPIRISLVPQALKVMAPRDFMDT